MIWNIGIYLSGAVFLVTIVIILLTARKNNSIKIENKLTFLMGGIAVSAIFFFFPICYTIYQGGASGLFISIFETVHNVLLLFVVCGDLGLISESVVDLEPGLRTAYEVFGAFFVTFSPLLTFGAVLSLFKNALMYQKFLMHYFSDAYIFSELNEKSLALAESLKDADKKCLLIFTDVFENEEERSYELGNNANALGALCFKSDIASIDFKFHSKKSQLHFMVMGEDESENISQTLTLTQKYQECENVRIDVFAKSIEAELLLKTVEKGKIKMIRRLNDVQSLISRILYETGGEIFEHSIEESGEKRISALILGMGQYGLEMAKALTWFCQMTGYRFEMNVIDRNPDAEENFEMLCPELLSPKYNGTCIDGEPQYKINIYSGMDVNTSSFRKLLGQIPSPTYVFVCLGSDAQNVKSAIDIRSYYAENEFQPRIQAVLYNSSEKDALYKAKYNDRNDTAEYKIDFVGDIKTSYSQEVILNSEVEKKALERHLLWGCEESFWRYEYNYRSSVASAIHHKMKQLCNIPYAEVSPEKRPDKERDALRKLEHCRWSAYVRSEGYTYGKKRNDLAKKHPCLVPYDQLSEAEKAKDDV